MTKPITCAHCGSSKIESFDYDETVTIKGRQISFRGQSYRCSNCGDEFDTAESMDRNLEIVRRKYEDTR